MNIVEQPAFPSYLDLAKKNIKEDDALKYHILPIVALACGVLFVPYAALGVATGTVLVTAKLARLEFPPPSEDRLYSQRNAL